MRIISPTGKLLTVNRAVPIVETIFDFNGESRFLGDVCRNGIILVDGNTVFITYPADCLPKWGGDVVGY